FRAIFRSLRHQFSRCAKSVLGRDISHLRNSPIIPSDPQDRREATLEEWISKSPIIPPDRKIGAKRRWFE
ncbi:MAG TPA: hypothetical protein VIX20_12480, partial [Ktedonobacteraceae bacterium]